MSCVFRFVSLSFFCVCSFNFGAFFLFIFIFLLLICSFYVCVVQIFTFGLCLSLSILYNPIFGALCHICKRNNIKHNKTNSRTIDLCVQQNKQRGEKNPVAFVPCMRSYRTIPKYICLFGFSSFFSFLTKFRSNDS